MNPSSSTGAELIWGADELLVIVDTSDAGIAGTTRSGLASALRELIPIGSTEPEQSGAEREIIGPKKRTIDKDTRTQMFLLSQNQPKT